MVVLCYGWGEERRATSLDDRTTTPDRPCNREQRSKNIILTDGAHLHNARELLLSFEYSASFTPSWLFSIALYHGRKRKYFHSRREPLLARFAFDFFDMIHACWLLIIAGFIKLFHGLTINLHYSALLSPPLKLKLKGDERVVFMHAFCTLCTTLKHCEK